MSEVIELRQSRPKLSLRRFARYAGVPYWQLRDFEKRTPARNKREQVRDALREQVKQVALKYPTYGYRFLYQELRAQGEQVGLHPSQRTARRARAEPATAPQNEKAHGDGGDTC